MANSDCASGYLSAMSSALKNGMVLAMSNWGQPGTSLSWLDGDTHCYEQCDNSPSFKVTNIELKTGSGPGPIPPSQYDYGQPCAHHDDDDCGSSCAACMFSWPHDDPKKWLSPNAKCRCKPNSSFIN